MSWPPASTPPGQPSATQAGQGLSDHPSNELLCPTHRWALVLPTAFLEVGTRPCRG